jgi:methionyl-tRNA synthetase
VHCRYCGAKRQRSVFCERCGFHIYEACLIDRRNSIKLYLACVALYVVLIMYVSR